MKRGPDYFTDTEPELVFIAKRLTDAIALEALLTGAEVDYAVETDEYQGGMIFRSVRVGAFFYVLPEAREQAVALMLKNGYVPVARNETSSSTGDLTAE
jgi:hypothetical protein